MKRAGLLIALMTLSACGHAPAAARGTASPTALTSPPVETATPSPSPTSTPAPSAGALTLAVRHCNGPIPSNRTLVLSASISSADVTLFDVGDPLRPKLLCTISGASGAQFRSATQIAYEAYTGKGDPTSGGAIVTLDLSTGASSTVVRWNSAGYSGTSYAFSPDGKTLAYVLSAPPSSDYSGAGALVFHLLARGTDRVVATLPGIPGRGGSENDDFMFAFSPDGAYVALIETYTAIGTGDQAPFQIRRADGTLVLAAPPGQALSLGPGKVTKVVLLSTGPIATRTMATWSGTGSHLYYRDVGGVYRWDPTTGTALVVPNLNWIRPQASPDGKLIAYTVRDTTGLPHVGLYDVSSGTGTKLTSQRPRSGGVFLTPSVLWLQEEQSCGDQCGPGPPTTATGNGYLYDLSTQQENSISAGVGR